MQEAKDFIGNEAAAKVLDQGARRKLAGFAVADDIVLIYGGPLTKSNPLFKDGKIVGRATEYAHSFSCD